MTFFLFNFKIDNVIMEKNHKYSLNNIYKLSQDQINFYEKNGFCLLRNVLSNGEVKYYRDIIDHAVSIRSGHDKRTLSQKSFYERAFTQCGHLWSEFPDVMEFTTSKRLAGIAKQFFRGKHARLWHDQALYKLPGGSITEPHQDMAYWPMLDRNAGTIWVALSEASIEMGAMFFIPGTHKLAIDSWNHKLKENSDLLDRLPEYLKKKAIAYDLKPGDATFHHGLTIHYTGENKTDVIRKAMCVIYFPDGVRYDANSPEAHHHCAAGTKHGEPIATGKNPILA